jgi:hypothetical protein
VLAVVVVIVLYVPT